MGSQRCSSSTWDVPSTLLEWSWKPVIPVLFRKLCSHKYHQTPVELSPMHPLYVAAIGKTDWGVRLLYLVSYLQTRGRMKMGLTLIVPQLLRKDTLNTCAKTSSILYYCQPLILAKATQNSAIKSFPKLIRFLLLTRFQDAIVKITY